MENPATGNGRRTYLTNTILKAAGWLLENGYKVPAQPQRFTAVERSSGDIMWAYEADTLQSLAKDIEESETVGVDQVDVYDLDRPGVQFIPERKIVAFFRADERVEISNPHQHLSAAGVAGQSVGRTPRLPDVRLAVRGCQRRHGPRLSGLGSEPSWTNSNWVAEQT